MNIDIADDKVLKNLANHLRELAEEMALVAATVSELTSQIDETPSTQVMQNLQKIDSLQQSLSDLAQLSIALSCAAPAREEALQDLKLAATRALFGQFGDTSPSHSGHVDLF